MAATPLTVAHAVSRSRVDRPPWFVWTSLVAATSALVGLHWDISWHISIGRDSFWTPAHLLIQFCGVLAGVSCGYLILHTTFAGSAEARAGAVRIWGFQGPLGAFLSAWGGLAMVASAPFDNWWHNAYGLDVKVLSPPHVLLVIGIMTVELGGLVLTLGCLNRAEGTLRRRLDVAFRFIGGMVLALMLLLVVEYLNPVLMHSAIFYRAVSLAAPAVLVGIARGSRARWAATSIAAVYTALYLAMEWILPLFPAQPKLGPVFYPVTHFTPVGFPLLLLVPAIAVDLLLPKLERWHLAAQAAALGTAIIATFGAAQWWFADFLLSPLARNWVFGQNYFNYNTRPTSYSFRHLFLPWEQSAGAFWTGMAIALASAILTTAIGLGWGNWMRKIKR